jgi:hypothetical protein
LREKEIKLTVAGDINKQTKKVLLIIKINYFEKEQIK